MPSSQHPTTTRALLCASVVVLGLLGSACGLKGPLYLPGEKPVAVNKLPGAGKRTPSPPAPQSQKKEKNRDTSVPPIGETPSPPTPSGTDSPETPPPGN